MTCAYTLDSISYYELSLAEYDDDHRETLFQLIFQFDLSC